MTLKIQQTPPEVSLTRRRGGVEITVSGDNVETVKNTFNELCVIYRSEPGYEPPKPPKSPKRKGQS